MANTRGTKGVQVDAIVDDVETDRRGNINNADGKLTTRTDGRTNADYGLSKDPTPAELRTYIRKINASLSDNMEKIDYLGDKSYFRKLGYSNFEDFCLAEFKMTSRHMRRQILASEVRKQVGEDIPETHARALAAAAPETRQEIYQEVKASGAVTEKALTEIIHSQKGPNGQTSSTSSEREQVDIRNERAASRQEMKAAIGQGRKWVTDYRSLDDEQRKELLEMTNEDGSLK